MTITKTNFKTVFSFFSGSTTSTRNGETLTSAGSSATSRPKGGFDVSSLIGLTDSDRTSSRSPSKSVSSSHPSPNMSVGPPAPPAPSPSSLYPFLFHPGFYQHLASGFNPMLLNAQLALAAQHNPLFASAYAHSLNNPGMMAAAAAASGAQHLLSSSDRFRQNRFSPYTIPSGSPGSSSLAATQPRTSPSSPVKSPWTAPGSPSPSSGSAFHTVLPSKKLTSSPPPESTSGTPPARSPTPKTASSPARPSSSESPVASSDLKSMENLVNGLNGSAASKFGISHDQREIST